MGYHREPQTAAPHHQIAEPHAENPARKEAEKLAVHRTENQAHTPHRQVDIQSLFLLKSPEQKASEKYLFAKSGQHPYHRHGEQHHPQVVGLEQASGFGLRHLFHLFE